MPDIHHINKKLGHLWFEVKRSKYHKAKKIQKYRHKKLINSGDKVFVVWSLKQVKRIINQLS
jgi:hypothetical protein